MIIISFILTAFFGFLKASTDRTLWGSSPNDQCPLIMDDWEWFQKWKTGKAIILWVPLDAWHLLDTVKYNVGFFAGVSYLIAFPDNEWWEWVIVAFIGWLIMSTTKWLFYEILFWKKPLDGFRNWKSKWIK